MAKKEKMQMPQSTAGLMRYYDEESKEALKIKPEYVAAACVAIVVVVFALRFM